MQNQSPDIVIFDDDRAYTLPLVQTLQSLNVDVRAVSTDDEFDQIDLSQTKCLILDFYLRETDTKFTETALPVLQKVRQVYPKLKVILHTGQAADKDLYEADQVGFYRYIEKGEPNSDQQLLDTVKVILDKNGQETVIPAAENPSSEIARLNRRVEKLRSEIEDERRDLHSRYTLNQSHLKHINGFKATIERVTGLCTSGKRPGILLDALLDDIIEHSGANKGAWIMLTDGGKRIRDQNCERLKRTVTISDRAIEVFGDKLIQRIQGWKALDPPIGPTQIDTLRSRIPGILQGNVLLCVFKYDRDKLIFVLEFDGDLVTTSEGTLGTYLEALQSVLEVLPIYISVGEFGKSNKLAGYSEQRVSTSHLSSRTAMSLLSVFLFWGAIISSVFAAVLLVLSVLGFSKVLDLDFHWSPTHYGVGVIHALEFFILSITLYLLGVGLSSMLGNARLTRVPVALRYLDDPTEMKRSLTLAVCTLLAVTALKFILELSFSDIQTQTLIGQPHFSDTFIGQPHFWRKIAVFGSKILASVIVLFVLTKLLSQIHPHHAPSILVDKSE